MNDTLSDFIYSLKKSNVKGKRSLTITPIGFKEFHIKTINTKKLNLINVVNLYEWSKSTLLLRSQVIELLSIYHSDSPQFWMKNIEKPEQDDEDEKGNPITSYCIGLDLEDFLESEYGNKSKKRMKSVGSFIPDNYELARKVFKEFLKYKKVKSLPIEDRSFRETAMWYSKDLELLKEFGNFIQKKYIDKKMKAIFKSFGATGVKFDLKKKQLDFVYPKNNHSKK